MFRIIGYQLEIVS